MNWEILSSTDVCRDLIERESQNQTIVLFKHSNRCSISSVAKYRFEKGWSKISGHSKVHLINVVESREVSNLIESLLNVTHESPQLLIVKKGKCTFSASHLFISSSAALKHM